MSHLMAQPVYSLDVPSFPQSLPTLTELCETFIAESPRISAQAAMILRLSVAEACRNALGQATPPGRLSVVTLAFYGRSGLPAHLAVEVTDPGTGFPVGGFKPPYRPFQIGSQTTILHLMAQDVVAEIESSTVASLRVRPTENGSEANGHGQPRGLGVLALCRCWGDVVYSYDPERGTTLRLARPVV